MTQGIEQKIAKTAKGLPSGRRAYLECGGKRSATPLWNICPRLESGVAAALCHRSPKSPHSQPPSRPFRSSVRIILFLLLFPFCVVAEVGPVAVRVPEAKAWIGQRVPFVVELRARGSFSGTASFDLPQIPGSLLMKIDNPVVGSQDLEGESWFVQTHEFALFSQRPGVLTVPSFSVRFASRDGFTGPATDVQAQSPGFEVEIQRPPGSEQIGFLITTESLDITETWEPTPGPAKVGAIFKRTIIQRAPEVPGMALAPAPTAAPVGIRVYPGQASSSDKLERGDFLGERSETITYLMQKPGTLELPALTYVWWNPKTEELQSKTLPAVTFEIALLPATPAPAKTAGLLRAWPWLLGMLLVGVLVIWQRRRLSSWAGECWKTLNPPDRVAARKLIRACRRDDAAAANTAWIEWQNTLNMAVGQRPDAARSFRPTVQPFQPSPELRAAVVEMQRVVFGPATTHSWRGDDLARTFAQSVAATPPQLTYESAPTLPYLNAER